MDFNFWESASRIVDTMLHTMLPLFAIVFGVSIAISVLSYLIKVIRDEIAETANSAEPIVINTDDLRRGFETVFPSGKSKNDEKLKNDEISDPFDPEPDYVSFEDLLAEKPKRKLKNDDL